MKKVAALLALTLVSAALVACGDDNGTTTTETGGEAGNGAATGGGGGAGGGGGGGATVQIEADPSGNLAFTTTEASAKAGNVTIDFENPQPVAHDVRVEAPSGGDVGGTEVITEGAESVTLKNIKPGQYTFYCSVPGHREAGMEGTLTVE
jgi:uncharacterized cupredoxin-like copper-binding protein